MLVERVAALPLPKGTDGKESAPLLDHPLGAQMKAGVERPRSHHVDVLVGLENQLREAAGHFGMSGEQAHDKRATHTGDHDRVDMAGHERREAVALQHNDSVRERSACDVLARDLEGSGPWLLVVTASNCPRCGPAKRAIEDAAGSRQVVNVDLSEHPEAGALPIWSVPAGVIVEPSGNVGLVKTGTIGANEARELVSALG